MKNYFESYWDYSALDGYSFSGFDVFNFSDLDNIQFLDVIPKPNTPTNLLGPPVSERLEIIVPLTEALYELTVLDAFREFDPSLIVLSNSEALTEIKARHYARNDFQTESVSYDDLLIQGFTKLNDFASQLHRIGEEGSPAKYNTKWVHPDGREYVFHETPDGWEQVIDHVNLGTYNFVDASISGSQHFGLDVAPWVLWGNTPGDALASTFSFRNSLLLTLDIAVFLNKEISFANQTDALLSRPGTNDDDTLIALNNEISYRFTAGNGDDKIFSGRQADLIDGGGDNDTVYYNFSERPGSNQPMGVTVNLELGEGYDGFAQGDILINIENVSGSRGADVIIGDANSNFLYGLEGVDVLDGGDGIDYLFGGDQNDTLYGGADTDFLNGGRGNDTLSGGFGIDFLDGGEGDDTFFARFGYDELTGGTGSDIFVVDDTEEGDAIIDTSGDADQIFVQVGSVFLGVDSFQFSLVLNDLQISMIDELDTVIGTFSIIDALVSPDTIETINIITYYVDYTTTGEIYHSFNVSSIIADLAGGMPPSLDNDAPIFASGDFFSSDENLAYVGHIITQDDQEVTLSISAGDDREAFFLADNGALYFRNTPDFETPLDFDQNNIYELTLTATDTLGAFADQDITVQVQDVSETEIPLEDMPPILTILDASVGEGGVLQFNAQLDRILNSGESVSVEYRILSDADEGDFVFPYIGETGLLTINESENLASILISTIIDTDLETEGLTLEILNVTGAVYSGGNAAGTILDTNGLADLGLTNLSLDRAVLDRDGSMFLSIEASNFGSIEAPAIISFNVRDFQTSTIYQLSDINLGTLAAGESRTLTLRIVGSADHPSANEANVLVIPTNIMADAGIFAEIDADNDIVESDESNNFHGEVSFLINDGSVNVQPNLIVDELGLNVSNAPLNGDVGFVVDVANIGNGNADLSRLGIYISNTADITTDDILIFTQIISPLRSGNSFQIENTFTIPINFTEGEYFIGAIIDYEGLILESDESDNVFDSPIEFAVGNVPGVGGLGLQFSSTSLQAGGTYTASVTIENTGATASLAGFAKLFLSDDVIISPGDDKLNQVVIPELDVGESVELNFIFTLTNGFNPGSYYAGVIVDDIPGNTSSNVIGPVELTVLGPPIQGRDLTWESLNISDTIITQGDGVQIDYVIINTGNAHSEGGGISIYASLDDNITEDDIFLGGSTMGRLEGGSSFERSLNASTNGLPEGDYYIGAIIDVGGTPNVDDDTSNNISSTIQVRIDPEETTSLDGTPLPGWENGQPANTPGLDRPIFFDSRGNRWDIDYDADIYSGNQTGTGSNTFYRQGYKWLGFDPDSAVYELDGDGVVFAGTYVGLSAERHLYINDNVPSTLQLRILDSITNDSNASQSITLRYAFDIDIPGVNNAAPFVLIDSDGDRVISTADTAITVSASTGNAAPYAAWGIGERDYYTADSFGVTNGTSYINMSVDVTLAPGETISFLHFGSQTTDPGFTGVFEIIDLPLTGVSDFDAFGRLVGLTPEDIANVVNWDVSNIASPADISVAATLTDAGSGQHTIEGSVSNLGHLRPDTGVVILELVDTTTSLVAWSTDLQSVGNLTHNEILNFSFTERFFQRVSAGEYEFNVRFVGDNTIPDPAENNFVNLGTLEIDTPVLFTSGDDVVELYEGGTVNALDGDDIVIGTADQNDIIAGNGEDIINGGAGDDTIRDGASDGLSNIFRGEDGNDTLIGGSGRDTLDGGIGNDLIIGSEGADNLIGGSGIDIVSYSSATSSVIVDLQNGSGLSGDAQGDVLTGFENIIGSAFSDVLSGNFANNELFGQDGADTLFGLGGADGLFGGLGDDSLIGGSGADLLDGGSGIDTVIYTSSSLGVIVNLQLGAGSNGDAEGDNYTSIENVLGSSFNDRIFGNENNNVVEGNAGNDRLNGLDGDDVLNGGEGADTLLGSSGADANNGGDGFDSVDYRGAVTRVAFNVDTGGTVGDAAGDTFSDVERYYLSNFNDIITGSDANEFFYGEDGNDTINAGGGIDRVYGGDGNDVQRGQEGNDQLYGSAGADQLNGGAGFDIANYGGATSRVVLNLGSGGTLGDAAGDTYFGIEAVYGSDFNDILAGNSSANEIRGGDGDDILNGAAGNDRLFGGSGADALNGGTGVDIAMYTVATAGVTLDLATGGTGGEAAGDSYSSIEWVFGSSFDDDITGNSAANRLSGNDGNDTLNGAGGNDRLLGGDGDDAINGGDGVDTIFGQAGDDIMTGGGGNDFFFGDDGADSHDGGDGTDTVSYLASSTGVTVNLQTGGTGGDATGDTYTNIERIFGSGQDDSLTGSDGNDTLLGNGGADFLTGGLGNDSLNGGAGVDSFAYNTTQDDADVIQGFTTNEVIEITGGDAAFDTWAELLAVASDAGANTIFNFGNGNTLTIVGQNIADLDAGNFSFVPAMAKPLGDPDAFSAEQSNSDAFTQDMAFYEVDVLL